MGKKRSLQPPIPDLIKLEVKDELSDSNVLMARDRFKGALRELLHHSDEESSAESGEDSHSNDFKSVKKGIDTVYRAKIVQPRKFKRRRPLNLDPAFQHHTYVMKLFDRSVDLAQFQEETPLYPICRAWIANQPRNPNLVPKARSPSPEATTESEVSAETLAEPVSDDNSDMRDIKNLPEPLPSEEAFPRNRVPSPIHQETEELNLNYDGKDLKSKETLLKEHLEHWSAVRKKWHKQAHKNEKRFCESAKVLNLMFKRAQSEYD